MFKKILMAPSKNLTLSIPVALIAGIVFGYVLDTNFLKNYILIFTFFMIYPTMIGFKMKETIDLSHMKPLIIALIINFLVIPLMAFLLAILVWQNKSEYYVGLIMMSLFPTSGMTISWTMLSKGNVAVAIKITAVSLILGSLLAPIYLYVMVGTMVPIDIAKTFATVLQIVIFPLLLGTLTYKGLLISYSVDAINKDFKPYFTATSVWFMLLIVFVSISMKAKSIVSQPGALLNILLVLVAFYLLNFMLATFLAKKLLPPADGYALVYGTVMRNLSIALGIAATNFGPSTALVITLAFILQVQGAAWYGKLAAKHKWLYRLKVVGK